MPPPRPDVSDERRAQIIQAGLACFKRKGFTNTSIDEIAAECGLSKGGLYWYFKSKDELFSEALLSVFAGMEAQATAGLEACATAADKLRLLGQATVSVGKTIEGFFSLFLEFWNSSSDRAKAGLLWSTVVEQYKRLVVSIIEEGIRSGEFKAVDAEALTWAVLAAYDGLAAYRLFMPGLEGERISPVFIETILAGLKSDGRSESE